MTGLRCSIMDTWNGGDSDMVRNKVRPSMRVGNIMSRSKDLTGIMICHGFSLG